MKKTYWTLPLLTILLLCGASFAETLNGEASYYADSLSGNKTASGEPYDKSAMTAAHRTLALGTRVEVTYVKTGKSVVVTINDRGPHVKAVSSMYLAPRPSNSA